MDGKLGKNFTLDRAPRKLGALRYRVIPQKSGIFLCIKLQ